MILLLVAITIVKLIAAGFWGETVDISQTFNQASAFLAGRDVMDPASTGGNPSFFLLGHYILASGCLLLSEATGWSFAFVIKTPAILADLGVALLLRGMSRGGNRIALLYMLNPVTVLLSVYHGQLHTVAMAGTVFALVASDRGRSRWGGLLLALAACVRQHFAVLIVPMVRRLGAQWRAPVVLFTVILLLVNAPLLASSHPDRTLGPTWTYGSWGYSMILLQGPRVLQFLGLGGPPTFLAVVNQFLQTHGAMVYWIWTLAFWVWAWRRPQADLWHATLLFLLGLYAVSPGFGVQWLVWVLPFWCIVDARRAVRYSVLAGGFLAGSYWQWSLNAKYGVGSLTANLGLLSPLDLAGVLGVGALGVATWLYATRAAWRLARAA